MNPPYEDMPSQIRSGSGQFDGQNPSGKNHQLAGLTIAASPSLSHWYAITSNSCAPRNPATRSQVRTPRM